VLLDRLIRYPFERGERKGLGGVGIHSEMMMSMDPA
jgi:hypothetical protein